MATYKKLCIDATSPARVGEFWATVLALSWVPDATGEGGLVDAAGRHVIWFNRVPDPTILSQRIRLVITQGTNPVGRADPEGGEFRLSPGDPEQTGRVRCVEVDSERPAAQARWWADVFDADVVDEGGGSYAIRSVPSMTVPAITFRPGGTPKTGPNRIHWDVSAPDVDALTRKGASVVRPIGGDITWHVLTDPEGNEFCAFPS